MILIAVFAHDIHVRQPCVSMLEVVTSELEVNSLQQS